MTTPSTLPQFNNSQANRIADDIAELTRLVQWVSIEGGEEEIIKYWQQTALVDLNMFKEELRTNRDFIGADSNRLRVYAHTLKDEVTQPADALRQQVEQWLTNNPNKGNATLVLFSRQLGWPQPNLIVDPKHELRTVLAAIQNHLAILRQMVVEIMRPLLKVISIYPPSDTIEYAAESNPEPVAKQSVKPKRKNDDARRREELVYEEYDRHRKDGFSHQTAVQKLVLNLKESSEPITQTTVKKHIAHTEKAEQ